MLRTAMQGTGLLKRGLQLPKRPLQKWQKHPGITNLITTTADDICNRNYSEYRLPPSVSHHDLQTAAVVIHTTCDGSMN